MTKNERLEDLERLLDAECEKYANDCTSCPYQKECDEYDKLNRDN